MLIFHQRIGGRGEGFCRPVGEFVLVAFKGFHWLGHIKLEVINGVDDAGHRQEQATGEVEA